MTALHEATRRQYLALLGIEQWLPRGEEDSLAAAPVAATMTATATAPSSADADGHGPRTAGAPSAPGERHDMPADSAAKLAALLPPSTTPLRALPPEAVPPAAAPAVAAVKAAPPAAASTQATTPGERLACSLLASDDGLLLVAAFANTEAPGLSSAEHEMLLRLAAALSPRLTSVPVDLHWPPRGARVPGMDRPGAARQALQEALLARQRHGARDLLLLGEELAPLAQDAAAKLGLTVTVVPSLATMLADPQAKRACWDTARPLRRLP